MSEENKKPQDEEKKNESVNKEAGEPSAEVQSHDKAEVETPDKFKPLVEEIEKMSVLDLADLVKVLEKKFGVSAAAPVAAATTSAAPAGGEEVEEKSTYNIELTETGAKKIDVIKALRTVIEIGLKDAKDMVEGAPKMIKEGVPKEEAEKMKKTLEEAGAKVTLK